MRRRSASSPVTEAAHPESFDLDVASTREVVLRLHREDLRAVEAVGKMLPAIARVAKAAAGALRSGGRLIYVGSGTSGRLAALDAAECPPTFGSTPSQVVAVMAGGPRALLRAIEGVEDDWEAGARALRKLRVGEADLVVGITASGSTRFVGGALQFARRARATTALVTCSPKPALGNLATFHLLALTGPELIAGSTRLKAGTATKLILNALSTAAFIQLGRIRQGRMVDAAPTNAKLRRRARLTVEALTGLSPGPAGRLLAQAGGSVRSALELHPATSLASTRPAPKSKVKK